MVPTSGFRNYFPVGKFHIFELSLKNLIISIVAILLIFLVFGLLRNKEDKNATHYDYHFKGENKEWKVDYTAKGIRGQAGDDIKEKIVLFYKGSISELSKITEINCSYESFGSIGGSIGTGFDSGVSPNRTFNIEEGYQGLNSTTDGKCVPLQFNTLKLHLIEKKQTGDKSDGAKFKLPYDKTEYEIILK